MELCAAADAPLPAATSFAYSVSHPVAPLPASVIERMANTDGQDSNETDAFDAPHDTPIDVRIGGQRAMSRASMCNAVASVARANDLPVPFFANLIWQESSFDAKTVSPAGALGVAQFMPETAKEYGLLNPFEPIQALYAAGKFLRKLQAQFGNLGLAAAAYNAGPGRVLDYLTKRRELPGETRNYVVRITGNPADQWTSRAFVHAPEATLMPAKAPCAEVAEAVAEQTRVVRAARLTADLAAAAQRHDAPGAAPFDEKAWQVATAKPEWHSNATAVVRGVLARLASRDIRLASVKGAKGTLKVASLSAVNVSNRPPAKRPDYSKTLDRVPQVHVADAVTAPKASRQYAKTAGQMPKGSLTVMAKKPGEKDSKTRSAHGGTAAMKRTRLASAR